MAELRLSDKQARSIAHANARINLWTGSIRSGKTIASLLRWLMYVSKAPRGGQLVVTGKTFDTVSRNIFGPLMDPAVTGKAARLIHYTRGASQATILGRQIEVITANDARAEGRLRGMTCAGAYGDELSLLPEEFFDQLLGRMSVEGAQFFGTSNPDNPTHWLRQRFILRASALGLRHWHFTLDDNPALPASYVAAIKREYVGLWYKRFIEGLWVLASGAVFDMFDEERHVTAELPVITRWISMGVDHGTRNPFHAVVLGLGVDRKLHLTREWRWDSAVKRRQLSDVEYSRELRQWLTTVPIPTTDLTGVRPERVVVDPSATGFRVQLHHDGMQSVAADNAVLPGIRTLASLFALDLLDIHESCRGLLDELPGYSWDDKAAAKGEDVPIKAADHGIDAARYAVHSTRSMWRPSLRADLHLPA